jgi:hypothetical protein
MKTGNLLAGLVMCLGMLGCSSTRTVKVPIPPRVDLARYQTVGLVNFASNADSELQRFSTQKFLSEVQSAQPGTRVVELGSESQVLASVKCSSWDPATFRAIQQIHGVDAILMGRFDVEKAKPSVQLSTAWKSVGMRADVDAGLSARLVETASGATIWTDSAKMTENVASGHIGERSGSFAASDTQSAYGNMVNCLVYEITDDFRVHYVLKRVPKDQVASAD